MTAFIRDRGINAIVNGMNLDDHGDYRPGTQAATEHAVHSPAAEAGMTKADIRELSQRLGLPTHDKPASPCLSSRIPYGEEVTPQKLRMIEAAEMFLRDEMGIRECRVRHHGTLALDDPLLAAEVHLNSTERRKLWDVRRKVRDEILFRLQQQGLSRSAARARMTEHRKEVESAVLRSLSGPQRRRFEQMRGHPPAAVKQP